MKAWFKKNWKWVVFPVGIVLIVLYILRWLYDLNPTSSSTTTDEAADTAVNDIFEATDSRDKAVKELEDRNEDKLRTLSEEQRTEYEEIKKGSLEDVAKWIDNL